MSDSPASLLVVLDVDSTLCNEEGIDEIARFAGPEVQAAVAEITARAMAGELDFAASLRRRVEALSGLPAEAISEVATRITPTKGAQELVDAVHRAGGRVCAVSGGFHELVDPLASGLGLDDWQANRLAYRNGVLVGELEGPLIDAEAKRQALEMWAARWAVPREKVIAVGDGANDLAMMAAAGLSVAFCAKPVVRSQATIALDERDLALVLQVAGIHDGS